MSRYAHVGIHRKYMCLQEAKFSYIIYDRNTRTHLRGQGSVMSTVTHPLRHHDNLTTHDALRSKCIVWIEPRREVPFKKGKLFVEVGLWRVYWMTCSGEWKRQPHQAVVRECEECVAQWEETKVPAEAVEAVEEGGHGGD